MIQKVSLGFLLSVALVVGGVSPSAGLPAGIPKGACVRSDRFPPILRQSPHLSKKNSHFTVIASRFASQIPLPIPLTFRIASGVLNGPFFSR